ncbi:MAG: AraC family transcriptional regulator [Proteobacteria bacterium]|nr:AraC family transcriptional regulator [Pseudomonadota bacterium]
MLSLQNKSVTIPTLEDSSTTQNEDLSSKEYPQWLERAVHYMIENITEELTLDDLANAAEISKFNFCRQFHRHLGLPPLKWLWRFRVHLASELLNRPLYWSVQDIAFAVGFSSSSHFSRVFREYFNTSPTEYRDQFMSQDDKENKYPDYSNQFEIVDAIARGSLNKLVGGP